MPWITLEECTVIAEQSDILRGRGGQRRLVIPLTALPLPLSVAWTSHLISEFIEQKRISGVEVLRTQLRGRKMGALVFTPFHAEYEAEATRTPEAPSGKDVEEVLRKLEELQEWLREQAQTKAKRGLSRDVQATLAQNVLSDLSLALPAAPPVAPTLQAPMQPAAPLSPGLANNDQADSMQQHGQPLSAPQDPPTTMQTREPGRHGSLGNAPGVSDGAAAAWASVSLSQQLIDNGNAMLLPAPPRLAVLLSALPSFPSASVTRTCLAAMHMDGVAVSQQTLPCAASKSGSSRCTCLVFEPFAAELTAQNLFQQLERVARVPSMAQALRLMTAQLQRRQQQERCQAAFLPSPPADPGPAATLRHTIFLSIQQQQQQQQQQGPGAPFASVPSALPSLPSGSTVAAAAAVTNIGQQPACTPAPQGPSQALGPSNTQGLLAPEVMATDGGVQAAVVTTPEAIGPGHGCGAASAGRGAAAGAAGVADGVGAPGRLQLQRDRPDVALAPAAAAAPGGAELQEGEDEEEEVQRQRMELDGSVEAVTGAEVAKNSGLASAFDAHAADLPTNPNSNPDPNPNHSPDPNPALNPAPSPNGMEPRLGTQGLEGDNDSLRGGGGGISAPRGPGLSGSALGLGSSGLRGSGAADSSCGGGSSFHRSADRGLGGGRGPRPPGGVEVAAATEDNMGDAADPPAKRRRMLQELVQQVHEDVMQGQREAEQAEAAVMDKRAALEAAAADAEQAEASVAALRLALEAAAAVQEQKTAAVAQKRLDLEAAIVVKEQKVTAWEEGKAEARPIAEKLLQMLS